MRNVSVFQIFRAGQRRQTEQGINTESLRGLYQEAQGGPRQEDVPGGEVSGAGISNQKANCQTSGIQHCGGLWPLIIYIL